MADSCYLVDVDGEPARVHGDPHATPEVRAALLDVIRAARAQLDAECRAALGTALLDGGDLHGRHIPFSAQRWWIRGYVFTGRWTVQEGRYLPVFQPGRNGHG